MTYMKSVRLRCDGDGCASTTPYGCWTATEERKKARENGWTIDGGKDYCPECDPDA